MSKFFMCLANVLFSPLVYAIQSDQQSAWTRSQQNFNVDALRMHCLPFQNMTLTEYFLKVNLWRTQLNLKEICGITFQVPLESNIESETRKRLRVAEHEELEYFNLQVKISISEIRKESGRSVQQY